MTKFAFEDKGKSIDLTMEGDIDELAGILYHLYHGDEDVKDMLDEFINLLKFNKNEN